MRFDQFEIDLEAGELRKSGQSVPLQDKPLQFLALVAESEGRIVTREEIRNRLWGSETFVEFDDSLNHIVRKAREALGDSAEKPRFIKTVPRRGYRFLLPLQADAPARAAAAEGSKLPRSYDAAQSVPTRFSSRRRVLFAVAVVVVALLVFAGRFWTQRSDPGAQAIGSLLVLPFRSAGGNQNPDDLAEGVAEQIAARLSPLPGLRLLASAAGERLASSGISPQDAGRRLHADAVLVGSIRRLDRKVRVNAQLIRTADSRILWAAGGLELEGRDLLEAETLLAASIATRLRGALTRNERTAISRAPTASADAYELLVRGKVAMRGTAAGRMQVAEQLFRQAIHLDPGFAEAYAWLASVQYRRFADGSAGAEMRDESLQNARRALAIDPGVTTARRALIAIFHSTGQAEEGLKEASILRQSGAGDIDSLAAIAHAYLRAGMPDRAVPIYRQALALDPEDNVVRHDLPFSAFFAGQHELGLQVAAESRPPLSTFVEALNAQAIGRLDSARTAALDQIKDPATPPFAVALCGAILRELGDAASADRILRRRLSEFDRRLGGVRNERIQIGMGRILAILGERAQARKRILLAQKVNPGDPWTLFFSADAYAMLGNEQAALADLREALNRGFLAVHYLDTHFKHWEGLSRYAGYPAFRAVRGQLADKVARLRAQY